MRNIFRTAFWLLFAVLPGLVPAWSQRFANTQGQARPAIISNIHNAAGWLPSHAYAPSFAPPTRVVNGAGWNPTTRAYLPRQPLAAYQLTSGACTSATSGPNGTGTEIIDGTCNWRYLSSVDYISLTGWAFDNGPWQEHFYNFGDNVVSDSPLRSYRLLNEAGCTSKVAPTGTGAGMGATIATGDGCQWTYWADIIYTSGGSHIPTQTYPNNSHGPAITHLAANYQANLWNDREYVAGHNGESAPIILQAHFDYTRDGFPYDSEGGAVTQEAQSATFYHLIVTTASGESFRDTLTSSMPLAGYDPAKGVAIHNTMIGDYAAGIELRDNFVDLIGLQIKSDHSQSIGGGETHGGNDVSIQNSIVDGGAREHTAAVMLDTSGVIVNSLLIVRGMLGVAEGYPGIVLHSTLINSGNSPNSVAVASGGPWIFNGPVVSNSAIFGFAHAFANGSEKQEWRGGNNLTDAPVGDSGSALWIDGRATITIVSLPGAAYGIPVAGVFQAFPGDYRPGASSPLVGRGAAFGSFKSGCDAKHTDCPAGATYNVDSSDIIGTARPQNGRYDIGALQSTTGQPR